MRRSAGSGYIPPGGSTRTTPDDNRVRASSGRHCTVWVRFCPFGKVTVEQFDLLYQVNVRAPFFLTQALAPELEKIGKLRQSSTAIAGKSYWMAFSNKGRLVKRGDRVTVVIGQFRAEGLVVE